MTGPDFKTSQETSGPNELIMQFMAQSSTSMIRVGIPNNNSNWNNPGSFRTSYSSAYNNSAAANSLPENFDFDLFIQFTRSATAEKRESAAKAAAMALERLDNQSETDMNHYIEALEELLSDFEDVQTMTLDKIYTIFNTTQKAYPELWEQLNQRIPKLVIKALRFSSQTQNSAINAITKLIEENLLTQAVIQTVIIPSLFDFVADFKAFQSDDPGAYEQWFANRVQVASVGLKIF
uniref:Uncharacterized protein n=1 Tax=Acrobeloides nanus TaxID=290746 RepID=A0A914C1H7_9BILA